MLLVNQKSGGKNNYDLTDSKFQLLIATYYCFLALTGCGMSGSSEFTVHALLNKEVIEPVLYCADTPHA